MRTPTLRMIFLAAALVAGTACEKAPSAPGATGGDGSNRTRGPIKTFSGTETRNGGYGIIIGGKTYSLDLYKRSSHSNPFLSDGYPNRLTNEEVGIIRQNLDFASARVQNILINKLSHLRDLLTERKLELPLDRIIGKIEDHVWLDQPDAVCLNVGDDSSPYENLVQVAYREGLHIRICQDFNRLDDANKAALLFHEIIYAGLPHKSQTMELTGLVFNQVIARPDRKVEAELAYIVKGLIKDLQGTYPQPVTKVDQAEVQVISETIQRDAVTILFPNLAVAESSDSYFRMASITSMEMIRETGAETRIYIDLQDATGARVLRLVAAEDFTRTYSATEGIIATAQVLITQEAQVYEMRLRVGENLDMIVVVGEAGKLDQDAKQEIEDQGEIAPSCKMPQQNQGNQDDLKQDQPKQDEPQQDWKQDEPKQDQDAKQDQPKQDWPKQEDPKQD